jgi:hypothetical protein
LQGRAEGRVDQQLQRRGRLAIGPGGGEQAFAEAFRQDQRQGVLATENALPCGFGIVVELIAMEGGGLVQALDQTLEWAL